MDPNVGSDEGAAKLGKKSNAEMIFSARRKVTE